MFDAYKRIVSVLQNSDMMARGVPSAEELALLAPFRERLPDEVFGEPFVPSVSDGSGQDRGLLRKATRLLESAGITLRDGKRVTPGGERVTIEFLIDEPDARPHHLPFIKNLATLGIDATLRIVDPVQCLPGRRVRLRHRDRHLPVSFPGERCAATLLAVG
jgi:microcin C transport system substrate-binding protein